MTKALTISKGRPRRRISESEFMRRHGILCTALAALAVWTALVWITAERHGAIKTTELLTTEFEQEYALMTESFKAEWITEHTPTADEQAEAQIKAEADILAKLIGKLATKQMKQTEIWNVFARVDSPFYPDTIEEVVNQEGQWMFYDQSNPIRDDDVALAMEQLQKWHEGRYPAGFDSSLVYGAWSSNDYYLFDNWEKGFGTKVWRYEE